MRILNYFVSIYEGENMNPFMPIGVVSERINIGEDCPDSLIENCKKALAEFYGIADFTVTGKAFDTVGPVITGEYENKNIYLKGIIEEI